MKFNKMLFLLNFFVWIRKNLIRIFLNEYPNKLLSNNRKVNIDESKLILVTSTDDLWVSKYMFNKWTYYSQEENINLEIFSNKNVNKFMSEYFSKKLIYEIYKRSMIPVQKIDLFRICFIYTFGGIWLDLKSEINLKKTLNLYEKSNGMGLLLYEPRKIEIIEKINEEQTKKFKNVIHNGFFLLPKNSIFLRNIINKIEKDFLYFQDISFTFPKQGIMNLTGPHQFTRTYHELEDKDKPLLISHEEVGWIYSSKFGEFISPFKIKNHYSSLKNLKTIDSGKIIYLNEK